MVLNIDANKITTIVNNLLANAVKFTPSDKLVRLELHLSQENHDSVEIKVIDSGIGISAEDLPHVFERFYQASGNEHGAYGGSGVGLALSQELAKLHGGLISVSSEINVGSAFALVLPGSLVTIKEVELINIPFADESDVSDVLDLPEVLEGERPKILLVEDHADMRKYIVNLLQQHYQVKEASDGHEALQVLHEFPADLIISDVKMPGMDGLTFAKKVKADEKYRLTPFINLTAHANEKDKLTALKTGVDDYLTKPFDAEELLARVQNLISNARERKRALEELDAIEELQKDLSHDEQVMFDLEALVKERLSDSAFSVTELAQLAAMSASSLGRHIKKMTGLTPGQFIRDVRLQKAIQLLESRQFPTIAEVVYAVGFEDVSSFSRLFKKRFGKSPSHYVDGGV